VIKQRFKFKEEYIKWLLFCCASIAIAVIILITYFILKEGFPLIKKTGILHFVGGHIWHPLDGSFGLLPMIAGSIYVTLGSLILGVPLGLFTAVFLAEIAPKKAAEIFKPCIHLLAGIPSVIYGFYGLIVLVPLLRRYFGPPGFSITAASIILAIMILPTIINISEDAIRSVPKEYKEGSLALGATHWYTVRFVIIPAARSGIITSVILGMGRALGETMAVIMVAGNVAAFPKSIFDPVRTLTGNIAIEMGYAVGDHQRALFVTGAILFIMIMVLNFMVNLRPKRAGE
jgi:phosphate transport system permease protein